MVQQKYFSDHFFTVDDFFSFSLINIPSLTSRVLHPSFFRSSRRRCFVTYSSSHNLTPAISRVMIGQHLIFYSPPWLKCCNSPRKCTPVKYKARQKAGFSIVTYTTSEEKVFLEISQNSQENNCVRVSFLITLQAKKKRFWHRCFPVNFTEYLWATVSVFFVKLFSNCSFNWNTDFIFYSKMWYLWSSGSLVGTHEMKNFNPIK